MSKGNNRGLAIPDFIALPSKGTMRLGQPIRMHVSLIMVQSAFGHDVNQVLIRKCNAFTLLRLALLKGWEVQGFGKVSCPLSHPGDL
jgi:hypothetical protein